MQKLIFDTILLNKLHKMTMFEKMITITIMIKINDLFTPTELDFNPSNNQSNFLKSL